MNQGGARPPKVIRELLSRLFSGTRGREVLHDLDTEYLVRRSRSSDVVARVRWFALPDGMAFPRGIAATADGHIRVYSESAGQIVRLDPEHGWTDRATIPVVGRHLSVDHRRGILWVAGGSGVAAIHSARAGG